MWIFIHQQRNLMDSYRHFALLKVCFFVKFGSLFRNTPDLTHIVTVHCIIKYGRSTVSRKIPEGDEDNKDPRRWKKKSVFLRKLYRVVNRNWNTIEVCQPRQSQTGLMILNEALQRHAHIVPMRPKKSNRTQFVSYFVVY